MDLVHPEGTTELLKHLGVEPHGDHGNDFHGDHASHTAETSDQEIHHGVINGHQPILDYEEETNTHVVNLSRALKVGFPYLLVFAGGVVAFIIFLTHTSFTSFLGSAFTAKPKSTVSKTVIPANQQAAYNTWIRSYFYDVSDVSVLDPDNDISGNGLTNYQKFLLGLNPKKKDTLGLGLTDTQALIEGIDPLTGNKMTDAQKRFIAANVDLETVSNKLSLAAANLTPKVAGANTESGGNISAGGSNDSGNTGGSNSSADNSTAPSRSEIIVNDSTSGQLEIPALKVSVPLIWTQDPKNFDSDLINGVVHYPGTAMPGEIGTAYISGHSSNYTWIKSKYNNIFAHLGDLKQYDSFVITVKDKDNNTIKLHYVVTGSQIYKVDDQSQFAGTGKSVVALSTCWPIGTSDKRLVVVGELTQVEK